MLFAEIGDVVWQALIAGVVTVVISGLNAWMQLSMKREAASAAKEAAKRVDNVKDALEVATVSTDKKLSDIAEVGDKTHDLVNSAMGVQLKISAIALRRLADLPNATPEDIAAADLAEKALHEHDLKQARVDQKEVALTGTMTVLPK